VRGRRLLGIDREFVNVDGLGAEAEADWDHLRTPETYLGYERSEHFVHLTPPRSTNAAPTSSPGACASTTGPYRGTGP
jgi:hypothetical protein